jgi:hypothetical protein
MTEITIVVSPAFDNRGKRRHDRFDARLQSSDELICEATRQPLLDASRELLRRGADPNATICKVRASEPAVVTMRARIGVAAQYDVMGEMFVRRKPAAGPMAGPGIGDALSAALRASQCEALSPSPAWWLIGETTSSLLAGIVTDRFGYRIAEWSEMTGTSRVTTWRNVKRGHLKLVYVGSTPMVPRSEAIRLWPHQRITLETKARIGAFARCGYRAPEYSEAIKCTVPLPAAPRACKLLPTFPNPKQLSISSIRSWRTATI